jgi:hypothetical protein
MVMAPVEAGLEIRQEWLERVKTQDPRYAACFCEHGRYVGSNRLFASKCDLCVEESSIEGVQDPPDSVELST